MDVVDRVSVIKVPVSSVDWGEPYKDALLALVPIVHKVSSHMRQFSRMIILHETDQDPTFNPGYLLEQSFFYRTFMAFCVHQQRAQPRITEKCIFYNTLIDRHFPQYSQVAQAQREYYGVMSQIAAYEAKRAVTDYINNITFNFGRYLKRAISIELHINERSRALELHMAGRSVADIRATRETEILAPARIVRQALMSRLIDVTRLDEHGLRVLDVLAPVFFSYEDDYVFANDNVFYDVKANPTHHFLAFIRLCHYFEQRAQDEHAAQVQARAEADAVFEAKMRAAAVVRAADTGRAERDARHRDAAQAAAAAPMSRSRLKRINRRRRKQRFNVRRGHQQQQGECQDEYPIQRRTYQCCPLHKLILYSHFLANVPGFTLGMSATQLWGEVVDLESKPFRDFAGLTFCGAVDTDGMSISIIFKHPAAMHKRGRKPCLHEHDVMDSATDCSTPDCPYLTTLTQQQLGNIHERLVFNDIGRGDLHFMLGWSSTVEDPLVLRYTRNQRLVETRMRHFTKLREIVKNEHPGADAIREAELYLSRFNRTSLNPTIYMEYIAARTRVWDILSGFYSNTMTTHTQSRHKVRFGPGHIRHNYPFHRKLRLSTFINQQQADERLKRNIILKFGEDPIMVCENWSASMVRNHAPIRGRSWRRKFKRFGFPTYLFDEFRTSKIRPEPECNGELETFKRVKNPRPYQRQRKPRVMCHGLLQCKICKYEQPSGDSEAISKPRVFNRDMAAVLNFRRIVQYYIEHGDIPEVFWRPERRRAAAAALAATALADAPVAATTTTRARGAARSRGATRARGAMRARGTARARGAAALATPTPAVAPTAMDVDGATAESSSSAAAASISTRRSNSTSNSQPPTKRSRNGSA